MKTLLFISALSFHVFLCLHPFSEEAQTPHTDKPVRADPAVVKGNPAPEGITYSDLLKSKASTLQKR